jgi:hypothetical protein
MSHHLTPDELVEAAEGTLASTRQAHVETCDTCRRESEQLAAVMRDVSAVDLPEPSPLFWNHFSARVRDAVAELPEARDGWNPGWLRWPALAPVGALLLLVTALVMSIPSGNTVSPLVTDNVSGNEVALDQEWALVSDMVGPLDLELAGEAGIRLVPGTAEQAALDLDADERQELLRLMRVEIERAGGKT